MARFGMPDSIHADRLFALPVQMQAEGLRLLIEMGEAPSRIMARTGLAPREVQRLVDGDHRPFARLGDSNMIGGEE